MCAEIWIENTVYQQGLCIGCDMQLLDVLFSAAADLQINRFLEAFHVTQLGKTHADTTCSYSTSWETLIFNPFGPYTSLQSAASVILTASECVCIQYFVNKCQIQLYYQHIKPSTNAWAFHKTLVSVIYSVRGGLTDR